MLRIRQLRHLLNPGRLLGLLHIDDFKNLERSLKCLIGIRGTTYQGTFCVVLFRSEEAKKLTYMLAGRLTNEKGDLNYAAILGDPVVIFSAKS